MGKVKNPRNRVAQKSICFRQRQMEFLDKYQGINIQRLCRDALDEQIKLIDQAYLENEEATD